MIAGFFGVPGSGKTVFGLYTVARHLANKLSQQAASGVRVWFHTNIAQFSEEQTVVNFYRYVYNLMTSEYKKKCSLLEFQANRLRINLISTEFLKSGSLAEMSKESEVCRDVHTALLPPGSFKDGNNVAIYQANFHLKNSVFFLDEAQTIYASKGDIYGCSAIPLPEHLMEKEQTDEDVKSFRKSYVEKLNSQLIDPKDKFPTTQLHDLLNKTLFEYHRHANADVFCASQSIKLLTQALTHQFQDVYHLRKISSILPVVTYLAAVTVSGDHTKNSRVGQYYFTGDKAREIWEVIESVPDQAAKNKFGVMLAIVSIIALLVLIYVITTSLWGMFNSGLGIPPHNKKQEGQQGQVQGQKAPVNVDVNQEDKGKKKVERSQSGTLIGSFEGLGCILENVISSGGYISCGGYIVLGGKLDATLEAKFVNYVDTGDFQARGTSLEFYSAGSFRVADLVSGGVTPQFFKSYFKLSWSCGGQHSTYVQAYLNDHKIRYGADAPYYNHDYYDPPGYVPKRTEENG